jgi:hypothetical protein
MGNLGDGCDIFAKLNERQIKNKLCSNEQEEEKDEEKNYLGQERHNGECEV